MEGNRPMTTIELNKDKMIDHVLTHDDNVDESETVEVILTHAQLNTIIVSLGMNSMFDIQEDADEDYEVEGELALSHSVYDYLMHIHDGIRLKAESQEG